MDDEPTDEMLKAGVTALLASQVDAATESEIVTRIFRAMIRAAKGQPSEEMASDEAKTEALKNFPDGD